ncbi:MAG TPA: acyl-CoA thioesterase domain-containing protein [Phenylobacterium sp.]|uniref:acyl-CoA thioesterase domain-containing protein n=1 Tax=Phenylobacterium sp. TaxID=1871053 RepID=UPI002C7F4114|nr:acyl-CoA thioesterase domain-containing protein [Phenylobacterium sp.]HSV03743.1 acyl-CoA thioesterase domain-containing protein [Phenylobacterium sp.]
MSNMPFYTVDGDRFVPTDAARGPWDPKSLHGRVIVGLLGAEIERLHGGAEFVPARLTVDMYRLPDLSPAEVTTRVVREGYRIKVIDAEFFSAGVSAGRATCQLLRRTEQPEGQVWRPTVWEVPRPEEIAPPEPNGRPMGGMWATRRIVGDFGSVGQKRTWISEVRELVEGRPLTPFVRVAGAADFASPFANAGDQGLKYINSDVTLYLHREPVGDWIGFEVVNHGATAGVAIGECFLYDVEGPIGSAACCALAQRRRM